MRAEKKIEVNWIAFPLHPEIPDEGWTYEQLFPNASWDIKDEVDRLSKIAADLDLPFNAGNMAYNSKRAQMLGKWAEAQGVGDAYHMAAFRAVFVDNRNIAQPDVLIDLASSVGLDKDEAGLVLSENRYLHEVEADYRQSKSRGVSAVPTFVVNGRALVGAQPYEELAKLVDEPEGRNDLGLFKLR